jgi:hypothetical protein
MSLLAVQGGATGTGTVTLLAPITNTNRTLTLPDATDTVAGIAATQTLTNKTLTSPTLTTPNIDSAQFATVSGTAPIYPCRAWVNFNGTGTVAIRASGNVSSITDNGTGNYSVNFTTAMSDSNYAVCATARNGAVSDSLIAASEEPQNSAALAKIFTTSDAGVLADARGVSVSIFR